MCICLPEHVTFVPYYFRGAVDVDILLCRSVNVVVEWPLMPGGIDAHDDASVNPPYLYPPQRIREYVRYMGRQLLM